MPGLKGNQVWDMLNLLRQSATGWLAAVLIGLLALSFAIWGVSDFFRGFGTNTVAVVGDEEVSVVQFQREMNQQMRAIQMQTGQNLTPQQAYQLGLASEVVGRLVTTAALDNEAVKLNLGVSDEVLVGELASDQNFQNASGQFDRFRFEQNLRILNMSETEFVRTYRKQILREQLIDSLINGFSVPDAAVQPQYRFVTQKRGIAYIRLTPDSVDAPAVPGDNVLQTYLEDNQARYRSPDYRTFDVLEVTPEALAAAAGITDADARAAYNENPERYLTPERRRIEQIILPDDASVAAAQTLIDEGRSFDDVLALREMTKEEADLGLLDQSAISEAVVRDAAFALESGEMSDLLDGRFGKILLRVTEIEAPEAQNFENVRDEIIDELALESAANDLLDIYDRVEDARAGGSTLIEIGQNFGLPARTIELVSRTGQYKAGGSLLDLAEQSGVLAEVFLTDPGVEANPVQSGTSGYIWFDVLDEEPSADLSLEAARDDVVEDWLADETGRLLEEQGEALLEKVAVNGLTVTGESESLVVVNVADIDRRGTDTGLPGNIVEAVFTTAKDKSGSALGSDGSYYVFEVESVNDPLFFRESDEAAGLVQQAQNGIAQDMFQSFVTDLLESENYGVNQASLEAALGVTQGQQ